jgi:hypothetical protein
VFSRCRGNVSTELFPSNGCCTVACLHSCCLAMGLHVTVYSIICVHDRHTTKKSNTFNHLFFLIHVDVTYWTVPSSLIRIISASITAHWHYEGFLNSRKTLSLKMDVTRFIETSLNLQRSKQHNADSRDDAWNYREENMNQNVKLLVGFFVWGIGSSQDLRTAVHVSSAVRTAFLNHNALCGIMWHYVGHYFAGLYNLSLLS